MNNECSECNAKLKIGQGECAYCGTPVIDADEQLLTELTAIARKFNEALAKGNKIGIEKYLADEYEARFNEGEDEDIYGKNVLFETARLDEHFVSYNIHDAELIERTIEKAMIRCIQTVTRRSVFEPETFEPSIERGTIGFVRREGCWQIVSQKTVEIDENGNKYE